MKKIFLHLLLLVLLGEAQGQIHVSAQLDSTKLMIGDQVQLQLFVQHGRDVVVENIDLSVLEKAEKIELIEKSRLDTINDSDDFILTQRLVLTSFDSGYHWIPPIPVTYIEDGKKKTVETNNLPLTVSTIPIPNDTIAITPIKNIRREPLKFQDLVPYLLGGLAVVGLVALILFLVRRRRREEKPAEPVVRIPPHVIAQEKLEKLRAAKLWQQGKIKLFQSELTRIVREYLENRYGISALESTTEETLEKVEALKLQGGWVQKLRDMFRVADLVKFAKASPPADFHDRVLNDAERFILETKPQPQPDPEEPEENDTE